MTSSETTSSTDFIREAVKEDLSSGRFHYVRTRFPPEPNGYLHIGHAKAINIDYGIAKDFGGQFNLRFDDTNPVKEETEYVEAIKEDIRWLGADWEDREFYASDYFEQLYEFAIRLIEKGKAYVDDLGPEEIREYRGTLTEPGVDSPYRGRSVEENLDLFERMRAGEFPEGSHVLRAKIDMASPNINLRDPVMYRILHAEHHRTGAAWCIYPMYDWAHGQCDSIEGVTHSLCDLAYEIHRPLYEWFLDELDIFRSRQIEFARLYLSYTILSKRYLLRLVEEGHVTGWDDPRMPTLAGLRRRGYTPEAIRAFMDTIGVAKTDSIVDIALLEHHIRQDLNLCAERRMAVLHPVKVVITNYPEGQVDELEAINNPEDESAGTRKVTFSREIYIEREDFHENPPKKYFRLGPGREVRLRYGYFIKCQNFIKNVSGDIVEVHCTYDPETRGGYAPDGRQVKGTLHWVSASHAIEAEVRLYDRLFTREDPMDADDDAGEDFTTYINPDSLTVLEHCKLEPSLSKAKPGDRFQFERLGYFCVDSDSTDNNLIFNRTIALRDTWAKISTKI
ncbi:MAG: glutamine--tRNA ligase/YqeY domain fusion protein [Chloroflexi bacterium]|nr:glutamine--tRNA ligase/YqeY domain fusion protein [Chloroflexota bacterium]